MIEIVAGVLVAAAAVALVLQPLLAGRVAAPAGDDAEPVAIEESESPKIQALLALREIEFDRATGKLSDEDYAVLKAKYSRAAIEAMKLEEGRDAAGGGDSLEAAEEVVRRFRQRGRAACPDCGPRPEAVAVYCSSCGRKLDQPDAKPRCWSCGAELPAGARFCAGCGGRVAA